MDEFELIKQFFHKPEQSPDVIVGIGDDAAVINLPEPGQLVLCMDTLVSGVHFPVDTKAADIAFKSLAVNISDMAAMGVQPRWITLSLTMPSSNEPWIQEFAESFHACASSYHLQLIGGDLSHGPLSVTVQLQGMINDSDTTCLTRAGAKMGDLIFVTGELGAAAYALKSLLEKEEEYAAPSETEQLRLNRPSPRLETGLLLRTMASSCIDISDGLQSDLAHILNASQVGAELNIDCIPVSASLKKLDKLKAIELAMTGGDDYELCFTLPADTSQSVINSLNAVCPVTKIGCITSQVGKLVLKNKEGNPVELSGEAYRHF